MDFRTWTVGLAFLLVVQGVYGSYIVYKITRDSDCTASNDASYIQNLIQVVVDLLYKHHGVEVDFYQAEGCQTLPPVNPSNRSVFTFNLNVTTVKASNKLEIHEKDVNLYQFSAYSFRQGERDMAATANVSGKWLRAPEPRTSPPPGSSTSTPQSSKNKLPLILGLSLGAAAAAAVVAAALMYRMLRKKNDVGDESDTTGILGGTPVVQISDAPNSVPPSGTG